MELNHSFLSEWTHFSSVTVCLSVFSACSRPWTCSSSLSMATLCCVFCCSSSRSAACSAFTLPTSLRPENKQTKKKHGSGGEWRPPRYADVMPRLTSPPVFCARTRFSPGSSASPSALPAGRSPELSGPRSLWPAVQTGENKTLIHIMATTGGVRRLGGLSVTPERSPCPSVWAELLSGPAEPSSSAGNPASPPAPDTCGENSPVNLTQLKILF